jgi:deoxycytidine triphosphate deaminase
VVDDNAAKLTGEWSVSSANKGFIDSGYRHNSHDLTTQRSAEYTAVLPSGRYEVRMSWPANANRATNVPVTIRHADGVTQVVVNQRKQPAIDGLFQTLGTFRFQDTGTVEVGTEKTDGHVILDAVQFLPVQQ